MSTDPSWIYHEVSSSVGTETFAEFGMNVEDFTLPPQQGRPRDRLVRNLRRLQGRRPAALIGRFALRTWPLSIAADRIYARRMAPKFWDSANQRARQLFAEATPTLNAAQVDALATLKNQGIYHTQVDSLLGPGFDFGAVQREAAAVIAAPSLQKQIAARRSRKGVKWYVVRGFGFKPAQPVPPAVASFILHDTLLDLVNSYLGLASRLIYLDLWYNLPVRAGEPMVDSELWHRDGEDRNTLKLFLYLSDVDRTAGPIVYLRQTHPQGPFGALFPHKPPLGSYPPAAALDAIRHAGQEQEIVGKAGTLVLYDGCGLHCGGRATETARFVLVATFASDAAYDQQHYRLERETQYHDLSAAGRYAIHSPF